MISQHQLKILFEYRNGHFIWRHDLPNKAGLRNTKAGYRDKSNGDIWMITINGKKRPLHRLVYLYHHGRWVKRVYHLDGNTLNNRIENLTTSRHKAYGTKLSRLPESLITSEDVKAVFDYKVGELYWKKCSALGTGRAGGRAGYIDTQSGYKVVNYRGRRYQVHRLIYLYHMGKYDGPMYFMDGDNMNTKIQNLSDMDITRIELPDGDFTYLI